MSTLVMSFSRSWQSLMAQRRRNAIWKIWFENPRAGLRVKTFTRKGRYEQWLKNAREREQLYGDVRVVKTEVIPL